MPTAVRAITRMQDADDAATFSWRKWTRMVVVDAGGNGDYTTIKAACDYVATQSPGSASSWTILVSPGPYSEAPFTIPTYTTMRGMGGIGLGNAFQAPRIFNTTLTSGAFITLGVASQLVQVGVQLTIPSGATGDCSLVSATSAGLVSDSYIVCTNNSTSYQAYLVYGAVRCASSVLDASPSNYITAAYFTGASQLKYCHLVSKSAVGTSNYGVVNTSGDLSIFYCRFGHATGDFFNTSINVTGGTVYINNSPAKTTNGAIVYLDRFNTTAPVGVRIPDAAAVPAMYIEQADLSEDIFEIVSAAGVGNAVEAAGIKTLTPTAFLKVTVNGDVRYIPCGTIA